MHVRDGGLTLPTGLEMRELGGKAPPDLNTAVEELAVRQPLISRKLRVIRKFLQPVRTYVA